MCVQIQDLKNPDLFGFCITDAAYMAQWLYPDIFADLDPSRIHQEYL